MKGLLGSLRNAEPKIYPVELMQKVDANLPRFTSYQLVHLFEILANNNFRDLKFIEQACKQLSEYEKIHFFSHSFS